MLSRCRHIAIFDIFPGALERLRTDIEEAIGRGLEVAIKAYQPTEFPGADIVVEPEGELVQKRWPGQWINLVVDGNEHLLAFLSPGDQRVHQAVWSGSAYLSWVYHCSVAAELRLAALEHCIESGGTIEAVREALNRYRHVTANDAPGYQSLLGRFGRPEQDPTDEIGEQS
jgi:hypothetical protein